METLTEELEAFGSRYPISIILEKRRNSRVSVSRKGVIIRLPHFLSGNEREEQISEFRKWAVKRIEKNPDKFLPEKPVEYYDGQEIKLMGMAFTLRIKEKDVSRAFSKIYGNSIHVSVPKNSDSKNPAISASIKKASLKLSGHLEKRAMEINDAHFRKSMGLVKIRNSRSTWGSCSRKGEITVSSRLLLAPAEIIDYVLTHEIAHLAERNHSKRFWKLVENAIPDYKENRKWLRKNGHELRF